MARLPTWFRVFVVSCLLLWPAVGRAGEAELRNAALGVASGERDAVQAAIDQLEREGSSPALELLLALDERRLKVVGHDALYLEGPAGLTPLLGAPPTPEGEARVVSLDNVLRRNLARVLARMRLRADDDAIRLAAAEALSERPSAETVELLRERLSVETNAEVEAFLRLGIAKADLEAESPADRLAAVRVLGAAADPTARDALARLAGSPEQGGDPDAAVREASARAVRAIDRRLFTLSLVANTVYGLSLASVLLLAALGLAITFGLMGVINMAHGEMLMIGAYATYVVQRWFQANAPDAFDLYLLAAIPVAFASAGAVGIVLERTVIRRLYGRPLETLLATWGLSLLLIQLVRTLFGAQNVTVANPSWLSGGWTLAPALVVPYSRVAVAAFTAVVVVFVWIVLQRTSLGLRVRAVTQNRSIAASLGIPTQRVDMWTFGLGSGVAGLGGVALAQLGNVGPELGQQHIIDSFLVVVVGGVGNLLGTIVGAVGLGMANKYLEPTAGAVLGKIFILVLLIFFIQWRPRGLFAMKGRTAED